MDDCRLPITGDSWGISDEWGRFCQLSLVPSPPRWSDWHWGAGGRLVRFNLDNIQEEEECGDRCYLEQDLESLKQIRALYLDSALKAKSKSRESEMMRGVGDKDRQIAWVEGKLRELGSDPGHFLGGMEGDRPPPPDNSQQFLGDKSGDQENISPRNSGQFLGDKSEKISPRKSRRCKGDGSGHIYWRTVTKKGKEYQEAYYHYEFWEKGDRLSKSSKYIPKGKLAQVQQLNEEKAPVREILKLLGVR